MKRRIFALLLALCMLPVLSVRAAEDTGKDPTESAKVKEAYVSARFSAVYANEAGRILACDTWNKIIWDLSGDTPEYYAGRIGIPDLTGEPHGRYHDAERLRAFFMQPNAIVPFLSGYAVTDTEANVVRYVTEKSVQTLTGTGQMGNSNGNGISAAFSRPTGLAAGADGVLYIADTGNGSIRMMTKNGYVSDYVTDLSEPTGICWANGSLYVAETGKNRVVKITNGTSEVLAGLAIPAEDGEYYGGYADGPAPRAEFDHPQGIAVGKDGTVYIADTLNHAIRMLKDGRVYTLSRNADYLSQPIQPRGLAIAGNTLFAACSNGVMKLPLQPKQFADVEKDSWYAAYADEAALRGLVRGTTETTFAPDICTNRAMFVTMLSRVHGTVDGTAVIDGEQSFDDIVSGAWYAAPARWSIDQGIINGIGEMFVPDGDLTREQAVVMLYRYANMLGMDVTADGEKSVSDFRDAADVGSWAADAMNWAVGAEIVQGADGALLPSAQVDRAQSAALLLRFMEVYGL